MAFKDNFRIEKIYFQRVKDDAQILGSWKNDPRRYSREEIVRVAKDACDSILMLYRLIGEAWNDALNQIEKLSAELEALAGKTEAYHDELNEKIDEVNNYLNTQIKNLEIRVENIENSIEDFGGLPSNANAQEGDVLTVGENHVNEWKTPKGPIYIEADYDENDSVITLTLNNETITPEEVFALMDENNIVRIVLNSFDSVNHAELPVVLDYVKTNFETMEQEGMTGEVETRFFQNSVMPPFSLIDSSKNVQFFNAFNFGVIVVKMDGVVMLQRASVVPYTFSGIDISLSSPVDTPIVVTDTELTILNSPKMHDLLETMTLNDTPWAYQIKATICYFDSSLVGYDDPIYKKLRLDAMTNPEYDNGKYIVNMFFLENFETRTSPFYEFRRWRVVWEYDENTKAERFYIPAQGT